MSKPFKVAMFTLVAALMSAFSGMAYAQGNWLYAAVDMIVALGWAASAYFALKSKD